MARVNSVASYEFIIVGGGSAGCVVAGRLAQTGHQVLLLEAGRDDDTAFIHMPGAFIRLFGTERVAMYRTTTQSHAGSRPLFVPQANTLGGGSSVNAMIYIRGTAEDYDEWRALGCDGWGWDDVLPVFKRSEGNETLSGPYHGVDGPLKIGNAWHGLPTNLAFVKAGQEIGLPYNHDFNGVSQEGVGLYQSTSFKGRRSSTAAVYLAPVKNKPNLTILTDCRVLRLRTEGTRVTGVAYRTRSGATTEARASRQVVLAAGALASPKILQLSGIGPAALLKEKGIPIVHDAAEVGENFQNHVEVPIHCRLKEPISLLGQDQGLAALKHGLQYVLFRDGLLGSSICEAGAFVDTLKTGRPDVQLYLIPSLFGSGEWPAPPGHGVSICVSLLRPRSRGSVKVNSADPDEPISFDGGALAHQDDVDTLVRGIAVARNIMKAPSFAKIVSHEIYSSAEGEKDARDSEAFVRKYARPISHVSGTCRMGSDPGAVVDTQLRVNGLSGLRVADASIIPKLVSGNTNAVSILIGERCADFMLRSVN
jgi:choline dehydrogenase-like flavoprotein